MYLRFKVNCGSQWYRYEESYNQGAQKLVGISSRSQFDIAFAEMLEEKIALSGSEAKPKEKKKKAAKEKKKKE